ncbi:PAS domain S-box protein [Anabaena sp. 4-3]|uniref:PAS domain S-box protein n=1 Tax=Anabaena sp. 4-3 TaxID=1811979 RepID=UPI000835ED66|nr:PAS domain S-box protein [Anabaena sp. 4-3]
MQSLYSVDLPTLEQVLECNPLTVLPDTLLIDAIALMNQVNSSASDCSGCVLVVEQKQVLGIFTLRDVVRLTAAGVDLSRVRIAEVMAQPVISLTLAEAENALQALSFMRQHRIRHVPIVDEQGQLLGLICQDRIRQVLQPAHLLKLRCVTEVMETAVVHALPTTSVLELSHEMSDRRISCIVIVTPQETKLMPVGMITEKDILKVQLQGLDIAQTPAQAVMSTPVLTISPTASLWTVHQLMQARKIRRLAVVGEQGELQGVLTQTNLLQVLDPVEIVSVIQALQAKVSQQTIQLEQEITQRRQVEKLLRQTQRKLELRVAERTAELMQLNLSLQQEIEERKQAETSCRESEQWLQLALWAGNAGTWDWNLQTNEIIWSESLFALFGINSGTFDGKWESFFHFVHPEDRELVENAIQQAINAQVPEYRVEFRVVKPDGTIRWAGANGKVLYSNIGQPLRMIGVDIDITTRKQTEAALTASEQRLQAIIDNSPAVIYVKDIHGRHLLVNSAFENTLYVTREQVKHKTNFEVFPPDIAQALTRNDQNVLTSRTPLQFEEVIELDDGLHTYLTVKFPLLDADGNPYAVCGISTDITESKQAQQKIQQQAALIDVATDAIFVHDLDNHILFWNRGAETLYGWTVEESLGKKADQLFDKESSFQLQAGLKATIAQGSWQGELEQITKTGREIIVASRWTLVRDTSGKPQSILVVNTDITEKKQLEQQFYRAQRLESIGTLASGIAHDLNNVFAPITMIAQLLPLRCKNVDARTQELFKTLENSSKRGANLVKQILTFARGTEGKRILLQPGHLLKELVKVIQQTFPKSIEIITDIPTSTLWMVEADPTQLEQVLMNLAVNARDAMPNGGILRITAENRVIDQTYARMRLEAQPGSYIVVTIADTGTGIAPEFLERIFDPFFTTKEVGKGTGLGLSTVLGIVKNHGGFVEVSSQVGEGTTFEIFLPIATGTATESTINTALPRGNGELILIVDDEEIVKQTTQETLTDYNYQTILAEDGIEAIALYVEYQPEISAVLLDMLMPNMDGLTTIRTLRTINPNVKIIATSGLPTNEQKAIAAGAATFLSKPYTAQDLLHTLSDVIGSED